MLLYDILVYLYDFVYVLIMLQLSLSSLITLEKHFVFRRYQTLSVQLFNNIRMRKQLLSIANLLLLHTSFMINSGDT